MTRVLENRCVAASAQPFKGFKKASVSVALVALLTGCGPPTDTIWDAPDSTWGSAQKDRISAIPAIGGFNSLCNFAQRKAHPNGLTQAGKIIEAELRRRGFSSRDREILMNRSATYGTGMSMDGLECAANQRLRVNDSFYPGLGHTWQVPFGTNFVYLKGNGERENMKVSSWN